MRATMLGRVVCFLSIVSIALSKDAACTLDSLSQVSLPISAIVCAIENGVWRIPANSPALVNAGCMLSAGPKRCAGVMPIPTREQVPISPPPPNALNKDYQRLAEIAEKVVPQTWFRDGFDNPLLLLSRNDTELPRKQLNIRQLSNKKLRNMYQCVTRQQFIRKYLDFSLAVDESGSARKCTAMGEAVVQDFQKLWTTQGKMLGGRLTGDIWLPDENGPELLIAALEVLAHFFETYGGIWTGCFKLDRNADCRGALAAASMVVSTHFLADVAGRAKTFQESQLVRGYMLASLGRHLLHGDVQSTGSAAMGRFQLRTNDFTALQQAYLRLYIDSFGALYSRQLNHHIPMAFPPTFPVHAKRRWVHLAQSLEPVYSSVRNWMFTESQNLIDFSPYRPLVACADVRQKLLSDGAEGRRRVLVDVGANGFFASPKYLLDSYAPYLPFTDAIMIEPVPHFLGAVPEPYKKRYNITHMPIYAEVATDSATDMLKLLPTMVSKEDFVVLKFDVDPNRFAFGPTMEWGFLFSLMGRPEIAELVDEIYIELHFHFPALFWKHRHSNWEALDAVRYLRSQGAIVHAWP
mmetsp:Transcript_3919/g.8837  ORF Transcript_3919/g.8837 Transcript_3919/m.8837 type:complete len:578 (-) Transcript_3919:150-1883(-)